MSNQRTLKLCIMFFLPVTDPEIALHVWKIALWYALEDSSHLSPEIVGSCTRVSKL